MEKILKLFNKYSQVIKFLITGGLVTLANITLLFIFTEIFGLWYLVSSVVVSIISILTGFSLQKWWTFNSRSGLLKKQLGLYSGLALVNLLLNAVMMFILTDIVGLWYILSQIITAGLLAVMNFVLYQAYIFADRGPDK